MTSFCNECRKKCGYSSDSESDSDIDSDTSSEYYIDSSEDVPLDLTSLTISEEDTEDTTKASTSESDLPTVSEEDTGPSRADMRKRKRRDSPDDLDFSKLNIDDKEPEENQDILTNMLSNLFVSDKLKEEEELDDIDLLTSRLSSKLRVSPKKNLKSMVRSMDIEDVPLKQRLRRSIKKSIKGKIREIPRERWSSKVEDDFDTEVALGPYSKTKKRN